MEDVNRRAWRDAYAGIVPTETLERLSEQPSPRELHHRFELLSEWTGESLVAEEYGEFVGYAVVRWGEETEAYVGDDDAWLRELYVDPGVQGEGVGTELVNSAATAVPEGTDGLVASALADNSAARGFYEATGFDPIDAGSEEIAGASYQTVVYRLDV